MHLSLLVTISENPGALYGVRFVAGFFRNKERVKVTLYSTVPRGPHVWEEEKSFERLKEQEVGQEAVEARFRKAIEAARKRLVDSGFSAGAIESKCLTRSYSTCMDIIQEGERGLYDAVVLGRRGIVGLETLVEQSVSMGLHQEEVGCPVWVCRSPERDREGVLLCLDGSEQSFRMADHVGFILEKEEDHPVTLFQVKRDAEPRADADKIFARARKQLVGNGLPEDLIHDKLVKAPRVAKAILAEADKGRYAVVAAGSTGSGRTLLQRMFLGSVSLRLLRELSGAAFWFTR